MSGEEDTQPLVERHTNWAVRGRSLTLQYGRGDSAISALDGMNFSVPAGSIYALLGPSGCGKTTLLKCILGRLQATGQLSVLGKRPGAPNHAVPGVLVGYMPQEVALGPLFSIYETMRYFGLVFGMSRLEVDQRMEFLLRLLDLPPKNRVIGLLSGGQQRRVSFAVALLQRPPLVILDEPTVGVDPVLRARIWKHLRELVKDGRTTVIITTHYIEEARQADMVAMMRSGCLLAESPPDQLMQAHNLDTLEAVFLRLSQHNDSTMGGEQLPALNNAANIQNMVLNDSMSSNDPENALGGGVTTDFDVSHKHLGKKQTWMSGFSGANILAMIWKYFIVRRRRPMFLVFEMLLPALQILLFCLAVGRAPTGLNMDVVQDDDGIDVPVVPPVVYNLSDYFVGCLSAQKHVKVSKVETVDIAVGNVRKGHSWGYFYFASNFSRALVKRLQDPYSASNDTVNDSSIHTRLDMSNQQIELVIEQDIAKAYECFESTLLRKYEKVDPTAINPYAVSSPVQIGTPIYGEVDPSFTDFVAPGLIISIAYSMSIGLTALSVIVERNQGLLDRSRAAGVTEIELLTALALTQLGVLIMQIVLMLVIAVNGFKVHSVGSVPLVFVLVILQGLAGMSYGLLLSAVCADETSAIVMSMGSVFPTIILSGILWPIQGMPTWLRYISYCLPSSYAATALRDIMGRGWSLSNLDVGLGFIVTISWLVLFFLIAWVGLRKRTF